MVGAVGEMQIVNQLAGAGKRFASGGTSYQSRHGHILKHGKFDKIMITVRDISKSYDSLKVLSDVNLDINKGEVPASYFACKAVMKSIGYVGVSQLGGVGATACSH